MKAQNITKMYHVHNKPVDINWTKASTYKVYNDEQSSNAFLPAKYHDIGLICLREWLKAVVRSMLLLDYYLHNIVVHYTKS